MSPDGSSQLTESQIEFKNTVSFASLETAPVVRAFNINPETSFNEYSFRVEGLSNSGSFFDVNQNERLTVILGPGDEHGYRPAAIYNSNTRQRHEGLEDETFFLLIATPAPGGLTNEVLESGDELLLTLKSEEDKMGLGRTLNATVNRIQTEKPPTT